MSLSCFSWDYRNRVVLRLLSRSDQSRSALFKLVEMAGLVTTLLLRCTRSRPRLAVAKRHAPTFNPARKQSSLLAHLIQPNLKPLFRVVLNLSVVEMAGLNPRPSIITQTNLQSLVFSKNLSLEAKEKTKYS